MVVQYIKAAVFAVTVIVVIATILTSRANTHRETPHSYGPRRNEERSGNMRNRCIVCNESLNSGEEEKITLNLCRHTFHLVCLQSYQIVRSLAHDNPNVCPVATCRKSFVL
uniref:Hypothetical secreted protein n=1 Tax=Triatoma matogrossensis TaxID=162370 RepID=E2J790_9HEMI